MATRVRERLLLDLAILLAKTQAPISMGMIGRSGSDGWEAWVRVREALGLHGWHTEEEAAAALDAYLKVRQ